MSNIKIERYPSTILVLGIRKSKLYWNPGIGSTWISLVLGEDDWVPSSRLEICLLGAPDVPET